MRKTDGEKMTKNMRKGIVIGFAAISAAIMAFVLVMNIINMFESQKLLKDSITSHLDAVTFTAKEILDQNDKLATYTSEAAIAADDTNFSNTLKKLKDVAVETKTTYIYVLIKLGDKFVFIYDTDSSFRTGAHDDTFLTEYELDPVHEEAFRGNVTSNIMNSQDIYGDYNTGARPLLKDNAGNVIAIVGADTLDVFIKESISQNNLNIILLVAVLVVVFAGIGVILFFLLRKIDAAQSELKKMAMYDKLTNLPNRRYLLEHLADITQRKHRTDFALLFIDLDNFKKVNDNAGHDAGDELLQKIGSYLQDANRDTKVFRPGAGPVNIAARVGGDEFVLVAPGISTEKEAETFAISILDGFKSTAIDKNVEKYNVGLSIGVALYPLHTENYQVLIKYADIAMYNTKTKGKNSFSIYNDTMSHKA